MRVRIRVRKTMDYVYEIETKRDPKLLGRFDLVGKNPKKREYLSSVIIRVDDIDEKS